MTSALAGRGAYRYLLPALLLEGMLVFVPLGSSIYYSLHKVRFFQLQEFQWFQNYVDVLTHPVFVNAILVTIGFSVTTLLLTFAVGFALALFLDHDHPSSTILRTVVLVPYVIAMLVGSMLLKWIFSSESGLVSLASDYLSLGRASILADPRHAFAALVANGVWRDSAFAMVLLLAGLRSIPPTLIAAARIDGARPFFIFREIVVPLLGPVMLITMVRLLLHFANVLTFPLILTGGGPNGATETVALRIFRVGFEDYDLGRANAMAVILCIFNIVAVSLLFGIFRWRARRAHA